MVTNCGEEALHVSLVASHEVASKEARKGDGQEPAWVERCELQRHDTQRVENNRHLIPFFNAF